MRQSMPIDPAVTLHCSSSLLFSTSFACNLQCAPTVTLCHTVCICVMCVCVYVMQAIVQEKSRASQHAVDAVVAFQTRDLSTVNKRVEKQEETVKALEAEVR